MTEEAVTNQKTQVATPAELAAAREARGMSQVDISQRIKLQVKQVNALEDGQWDALPGRSFVRGALRSYGKLLDVDVGPLLESIGGFAEPAQVSSMRPLDTSLSRSAGHGFNGGGRGSPILWVIAGLIGVVALVLYFGSDGDSARIRSWLPSGTTADPAPAPPSPSPSSAPAPGAASSRDGAATDASRSSPPSTDTSPGLSSSMASSSTAAPGASARAGGAPGTGTGSPAPAPGAPATSPAVTSAPAAASPSVAAPAGNGPAGISASAGAPSPPPSASPADSVPAPPQGAGSGSATSPSTAATAKAPGAAPASPIQSPADASPNAAGSAQGSASTTARDARGQIRLKAGTQGSWVEVRQADGTALHNGLVKAGDTLELHGKPPYRLVLGNASHLEVAYEGKVQDLAPHMGGNNIARLQLK